MYIWHWIVLTCLLAILVFCSNATAGSARDRIVGGLYISIDKRPYLVQLRQFGTETICGGTLVSPRYVVTAAHCFVDLEPYEVVVVGGVSTMTEAGVQRNIVKITKHPEYHPDTMHSDIAVLKLDDDMYGPNIKPVSLCSRSLQPGEMLQVSGWGSTREGGEMSHYLRTVNLPVFPDESCRRQYGHYVAKNMLCATVLGSKDACGGDSGGPAVNSGELCGIIAFGYGCARVAHAGTYTNVYAVRAFIEQAMNS